MKPSINDLLETFFYSNGVLIRRTTGNRGYIRPDGYVYVRFMGRAYGEHRLIHLIFSGEWPYQVDHVNGIRNDNQPSNLRSATHSQNCMNRKSITGKKGCYWNPRRQKWMVQVGLNGRRKTVGYFDDLNSALKARAEMAKLLHGEFAR